MMKLNCETLNKVQFDKPDYDRDKVRAGIVHLGIGAFHRAHQAVYIDDILAREPDWGIIGASLRSPATAKALTPQNGLYTLIEKGEGSSRYRVIGSVLEILVARDMRENLLNKMAHPDTRIVSLTITEKGYCHDPASGQLNTDHPDIKADISAPRSPVSAPGIIVEALSRRREAGRGPFTVLSCDNLPTNGRICRNVVLALADFTDRPLVRWIEENVTFPGTMVDRIVPATTDDDRELLRTKAGLTDNWPVVTEPFSQWVIEDHFCAGRPNLEEAGVQMVTDVEPFETMKLRLLNGCHSTLAYLGSLAGHRTVAQAIRDRKLASFIKDLMREEIAPTLDMPENIDLGAYQAALLSRFRNTGLQHKLFQIASDGSQKLPQRLLNPIRERLRDDLPIHRLAKCVASWIAFISARSDGEFCFELDDPMAGCLRRLIIDTGSAPQDLVRTILAIESIFGPELLESETFAKEVSRQLKNCAI
jgi:fructuronate reductase